MPRDFTQPITPPIFEGYITEAEYAAQRGVSLRTCQRDRAMRQAPPHLLIGKSVYYRIEAVRDWLRRRETVAESRPANPSRGRHR